MSEINWRKMPLDEALARPDIQARLQAALASGPLCNHCLGRLLAQVDTGLGNEERGRRVRAALAAPAPPDQCALCRGLLTDMEPWVAKARRAVEGWEFRTLAVSSHASPRIVEREEALWQLTGPDLAEPYKQAFNRLLGTRLCDELGREADLKDPDIIFYADHRKRRVTARVEPLFACGRYRKLVRGISQCRWPQWPTSVQEVIGDPVLAAAGAEDHLFHGCGREDVDVRCLGERPFTLEVIHPHHRQLDWDALARTINASGKVEVVDFTRCKRESVARLKGMHPEKSYRALVRLAAPVEEVTLARLAGLVGVIQQQTPTRVLRRRPDLVRPRRVHTLEWRRVDGQTLEIDVRTQAGTYIKELISSDGGRTRPSVAEVLGVPAVCAELDVTAIHVQAE
jgi:tRNA pseudouridine synthase 10